MTCTHGDRFAVMLAKDGCIACQCALEAEEKTKAREWASRMQNELVIIAEVVGVDLSKQENWGLAIVTAIKDRLDVHVYENGEINDNNS